MRNGSKKVEFISDTQCCALWARVMEHESHGAWRTRCWRDAQTRMCRGHKSFPSFLASFLYLRWFYEYFGILHTLNTLDFEPFLQKQICDSIHCCSSFLPFTILRAILVQMRGLWFQLIWIHFSNKSSWATLLKLRSITSSALSLSANIVMWFLSHWVSLDMISYVGTWADLPLFYLYTCLCKLYGYFLLGYPLIVLERFGIAHFYLFYN